MIGVLMNALTQNKFLFSRFGRYQALTAIGLLFCAGLSACSSASSVAACTVAADCASGVCQADHTCAPVANAGADVIFSNDSSKYADGTTAGGQDGAAVPTDGSVSADVATADGAKGDQGVGTADGSPADSQIIPGSCVPNHDGVVTRAEMPVVVGATAQWRAASNATFAVAGAAQADGSLQWDLAKTLTGDHDLQLKTLPITGAWYAAAFTGATYVSQLAESSDLLGIFQVTDSTLLLLGVASPTDGLQKTELTYTPPVVVLQFPLQTGSAWTTSSSVTGTATGMPVLYTETWTSKADAQGSLLAPLGTLPVLRVRTRVDRLIGMIPSTLRSVLFVSECLGTVAAADAASTEYVDDFSQCSSVRRIGSGGGQ